MEITVYDSYTMSIHKYPRLNNDCDKILITFLMHEDFLKKMAESYDKAITYYHDCKEYFYNFSFQGESKTYSANMILLLMKNIHDIYLRLSRIDKIFFFYMRNKIFFTQLFEAIDMAKSAYFQKRESNYIFAPPLDFYKGIPAQSYTGLELLEIHTFASYLTQRGIIKELPIPHL